MHKPLALASLFAALLLAVPALAQIAPGSAGLGTKLGIESLNNSGQVGEVTLFNHGAQTQVVLDVKSTGGAAEAAHIHRGKSCEDPIDPTPAYTLKNVVGGHSTTTIAVPESKLLSGNYVVIVHSHSATATPAQMESPKSYVACSHLYR